MQLSCTGEELSIDRKPTIEPAGLPRLRRSQPGVDLKDLPIDLRLNANPSSAPAQWVEGGP